MSQAIQCPSCGNRGKPSDAYCSECGFPIGEVRALKAEAAKRPRQATQMGNQGHAGEGIRLIREYVEAGLIGPVRRVEYWTNRPIWPQAINRSTQAHNVPETLDWNLWLGPAAERPYNPAYAPFNWRGWWDFGTTQVTCRSTGAASARHLLARVAGKIQPPDGGDAQRGGQGRGDEIGLCHGLQPHEARAIAVDRL